MKKCAYCGRWRALDQFSIDPSKSDGLNRRCRACRSEYARLRRTGMDPAEIKALLRQRAEEEDGVTELEVLRQQEEEISLQIAEHQDAITNLTALYGPIREQIARLTPPFSPGQWVRVHPKSGTITVQVDRIERAFDQWVIEVHFPHNRAKKYFYPAALAEAA